MFWINPRACLQLLRPVTNSNGYFPLILQLHAGSIDRSSFGARC